MRYRFFRHNGQVLDRIDGYEDAHTLSADGHARTEVAAVLNVDVSTVSVEHADSRPAVESVMPPAVSPPPPPGVEERLDTLTAIVETLTQKAVVTRVTA